jgi:putative ABC transport system substrate-binding protein
LIEGVNVAVEYRWAEGRYERLPDLVTELVRTNAAVIVTHGTPGTIAAKRVTTTVPIVAAIIGDPLATGVVTSIARPDGNITGQSFFNPELRAKRIEFLKEAIPGLTKVAVLVNPDSPAIEPEREVMQAMAGSLSVRLWRYPARSINEFEGAFDQIVQAGEGAVEIGDEALMKPKSLRRWQPSGVSPRSGLQSSDGLEVSSDMASISRPPFAEHLSLSRKYSRAPSPPTCRSSGRRASSSS